MNIKFISVITVLFVLILACSNTPTALPTTTGISQNQVVQPANDTSVPITQTSIPSDTPLPLPTNTRIPTNTPRPPNTPKPTNTKTPTPAPVVLIGSGDSVVDTNWSGPGLLYITYTGGGNFAVWNYSANGERISLLVNTIGSYSGTVPLDFGSDEVTTRLEITASGNWEIQIVSILMMRIEHIPGTFTGSGDDVVYLAGGAPDLMVVDASTANGNFAIWSYGDSGRDLLVNEIAPYTGTVIVPRDDFILEITAEGSWSIEVKTP
jgi:hypothetical protein